MVAPATSEPRSSIVGAELLRRLGASQLGHQRGRSLFDHLIGTERILAAWKQPEALCAAGALHSIYGTDVYGARLVSLDRRTEIQEAAGKYAERLAYLFCATPRADLFAAVGVEGCIPDHNTRIGDEDLEPDDCAALLTLHMANLAEQAGDAEGGPAHWVSRVLTWGQMLRPDRHVIPEIVQVARPPTDAEEGRVRRLYRQALAAIADEAAASKLDEAAAICPSLAEPRMLRAYHALLRGDGARALELAKDARSLLQRWGVPWDKRLSIAQWLRMAALIEQAATAPARELPLPDPAALPRFLTAFAAALGESNEPGRNGRPVLPRRGAEPGLEHAAPLSPRFCAYLSRLTRGPTPRHVLFPGLAASPWHDASRFPIVQALQRHFPTIREEVLRLGDAPFQPESEPIERTGAWDVSFLYESGRRHDETCARCPTLTAIVEDFPTVRTHSGLIYVSRLRPGTAIRSHYGPSNLRLRCHLPIVVPERSCGISVAGDARAWREGECIVFDDTFHHHAWNHSDQDRIVVVIDLWHPDLTEQEIELVSGLQRYVAAQSARLDRYYDANARARGAVDPTSL